jgi:hypothetical protein
MEVRMEWTRDGQPLRLRDLQLILSDLTASHTDPNVMPRARVDDVGELLAVWVEGRTDADRTPLVEPADKDYAKIYERLQNPDAGKRRDR